MRNRFREANHYKFGILHLLPWHLMTSRVGRVLNCLLLFNWLHAKQRCCTTIWQPSTSNNNNNLFPLWTSPIEARITTTDQWNQCKVPGSLTHSFRSSNKCTKLLFILHSFRFLQLYENCMHQPIINKKRDSKNYLCHAKGAPGSKNPVC